MTPKELRDYPGHFLQRNQQTLDQALAGAMESFQQCPLEEVIAIWNELSDKYQVTANPEDRFILSLALLGMSFSMCEYAERDVDTLFDQPEQG